jgi:hypothetical protein
VRTLVALFLVGLALAQAPPAIMRTYQDPRQPFQFQYASEFGTPSPGTDGEFGNRIAAIRFSEFSAGVRGGRIILGGEAVLTRGAPQLDLQAAGGLYDSITLEIFPAGIAALIQSALPVLTAANLCAALQSEQHLDPADLRLQILPAPQRDAIPRVDRMGNVAPKVLVCGVSGETITFDKETARDASGPRQHIYGAVRFLPAPYSTFQVIRGGADPPGAALLQEMTSLVNSWQSSR